MAVLGLRMPWRGEYMFFDFVTNYFNAMPGAIQSKALQPLKIIQSGYLFNRRL